MDKNEILKQIIAQMEQELLDLIQAAKNTYEIATHEENKPENEYDTRGLEASYLAGAQAERVGVVREAVHALKQVRLRSFKDTDAAAPTSLVTLVSEASGDKKLLLFILPAAAGVQISHGGESIQVVTPGSPLGAEIVGQKVGDEVIVKIGAKEKYFEIENIE